MGKQIGMFDEIFVDSFTGGGTEMTCKDCIHFDVCGVCQKAFLSLDKIESECIAYCNECGAKMDKEQEL